MKLNKIVTIVFSLLFVTNVFSQIQLGHSIRLSENWFFLKSDLGGVWEAFRPAEPESPESVPVWEPVTLPHCYNALDVVDPLGNYYQGPAWYKSMIEINNPYPGGRTLLHFQGVGQESEVFIYTTKVGSHVGGYDAWEVDITDAVEAFRHTKMCDERFEGKIPVAVRVDNSRDTERIPSAMSDFNLYGGIYRHLDLVYLPALYMDKPAIVTQVDPKTGKGKFTLSSELFDFASVGSASVSVTLRSPDGKIIKDKTEHVGSNPSVSFNIVFDVEKPELWSPASPVLYTCDVLLKSDAGEQQYTEKVGFRYFEFLKQGPFMLNGKRLLLRGTHRHEDHAGVGAAMTDEQITEEMKLIKNMGANFVRLGHYQQSDLVLRLCDELGIIVWEEIPWCRGGLGGQIYQAQAKRMLTNMIKQHRNHPSVIVWGLGNENDWPGDFEEFDTLKIQGFMSELNQLSHQLDPARVTSIRRCDFCKNIVDVYSPSIWAGWYRGLYTDYKRVSENEMKKTDHFLHVEWGGDSHAGRHSEHPNFCLKLIAPVMLADERAGDATFTGGAPRVSKDGDWSESYIIELFDWHLKEQEKMPWLTGTAFWTFKDFSTPLRPDNPIPFVNQKGVVGRDLILKESYYVFQSYWSDMPMVHIYGHTWPVRWGEAGELKMVKVFSNCDQAELFMNGVSQGIRKRDSQDFPAAGLRWNVVYKKGNNQIKVVARKGKTILTDEISQEYQTEKWGEVAKIGLKIEPVNDKEALVVAQLYDENGVRCLDSRDFVEFDLTGDDQLVVNQGTVTGSKKIQARNGRAEIRVVLQKKNSVVSVKTAKARTEFISIN